MRRECGELEQFFTALNAMPVDGIMVGNLGTLKLARTLTKLPVQADHSFNIFNHLAVTFLKENGLTMAAASYELSFRQLRDIAENAVLPIEAVVHGRGALCEKMTAAANALVSDYGITVIDIVPRQIKYSDELTESVYNRMIKDRSQVAQAYRSLGEAKKTGWIGRLENEKRTISSDAYRRAEEIKGQADAEAARIYAEAYNRDPEFYAFWKSMESYANTLKGRDATYSTNMDYFRYLYSPEGRR